MSPSKSASLEFSKIDRGTPIHFGRPSRSLSGKVRLMIAQGQFAPEWGVGGFPECFPFSNICANPWVPMSSIYRSIWKWSPGGLLEVNVEDLELCILEGILVTPSESLCWIAISMDEPEVRRVGFAQALPSCPSPGPELHSSSWGGEGALVRAGGLCAMLEKPKFVPMARPYASDIPIYLFFM